MQPHKWVVTAGLVVCRQRPATARGIVFLLLEDEFGLVNVLIPRELYEREGERMLVRTSAFLRISGPLEGHAGAVPMLKAERVERLSPAKSGEYPAKPGEGVPATGVPAKPASWGGGSGEDPATAGGGEQGVAAAMQRPRGRGTRESAVAWRWQRARAGADEREGAHDSFRSHDIHHRGRGGPASGQQGGNRGHQHTGCSECRQDGGIVDVDDVLCEHIAEQ